MFSPPSAGPSREEKKVYSSSRIRGISPRKIRKRIGREICLLKNFSLPAWWPPEAAWAELRGLRAVIQRRRRCCASGGWGNVSVRHKKNNKNATLIQLSTEPVDNFFLKKYLILIIHYTIISLQIIIFNSKKEYKKMTDKKQEQPTKRKKLTGRGGPGRGQGRKPLGLHDYERRVIKTILMPPWIWDALRSLPGWSEGRKVEKALVDQYGLKPPGPLTPLPMDARPGDGSQKIERHPYTVRLPRWVWDELERVPGKTPDKVFRAIHSRLHR